MTIPQLLTVADAAKQLSVNQRTVRRWIDRGELGSVRIGNRILRVEVGQLRAFIENYKIHPGQPALEVDDGELEDGR